MTSQISLMAIMIIAALLGSIGQIFLSKASGTIQINIKTLIMNWYLWGFVVTYGLAALIQTLVYKAGGKVALIYPVISLSYIFAAILAWKFLDESITIWTWIGIIIIIFGVSLIGYGAANGVISNG